MVEHFPCKEGVDSSILVLGHQKFLRNFMLHYQFKHSVNHELLDRIRASIVENVEKSRFFYDAYNDGNHNRGVFPDNRSSFAGFYPKENAELIDMVFPVDDPYLKSGVFTVYFSYGKPDTYMTIHKDMMRRCAINFNLLGCDGCEVHHYHSKSGETGGVLQLDDAVSVEHHTLTDSNIVIMDTKTHHAIPQEFLKNRDCYLLSYGWYTHDIAFSMANVVERLKHHGLLML